MINELRCFCVSVNPSPINNILDPHAMHLMKSLSRLVGSLAKGLRTGWGCGTTLSAGPPGSARDCLTLDKLLNGPCLMSSRVKQKYYTLYLADSF